MKPIVPTVRDLLQFEHANLWDWSKFRVYFFLRNLWYDVAAIHNLQQDDTVIEVFTNRRVFSQIPLLETSITVHVRVRATGDKLRHSPGNLFRFGALFLQRWLNHFGEWSRLNDASIAFINRPKQEIPLRRLDGNGERLENPYFGYLFSEPRSDTVLIDEVDLPELKPGFSWSTTPRMWSSREAPPSVPGLAVWGRYGWRGEVLATVRRGKRFWKEQLDRLGGLDLDPREACMVYVMRRHVGAAHMFLRRYACYRRLFRDSSIRVVCALDENSPAIASILAAARAEGVKTVGLQHGAIHELNMAYRNHPRALTHTKAMPDFTLTWGSYWSDILATNGGFDPETIVEVGQPRSDIIPRLLAQPAATPLPGVDPTKPLIVFASQPQRDQTLRRRAARDMIAAAMRLQTEAGCQLVFKLHPIEQDPSYYQSVADELNYGTLNQISVDVDLYAVLQACDVLVTCFSTVGGEAVYFGKPLVVLDHLQQDVQDYVASGVARLAVDEETLYDHLAAIVREDDPVPHEAYEAYIRAYAHAVDGHVRDRIWNFLESAVNQS